ncbi:hypothetical protein H4R34_002726 [Dimargaris verticillata]|uniref:Uncharacterized protein n=1 Tax=Dimargaris verticillata TaxID=2761393 RepID=A0A9W8B283_9FUNG|nr:hypothetical protein H4R34_002726 [Dimargaris verticillata]
MGGSLIPKHGILYGRRESVIQANGTTGVSLQVKGFAPYSHSDQDLATVLSSQMTQPNTTVVGWYSAPAVNVPTDNLTPKDVATCYFDIVESTLLKILTAQCIQRNPDKDMSQLMHQLADEAANLFRQMAGIVVWMPCMTPSAPGLSEDSVWPVLSGARTNPHVTVAPNSKRDPTFLHHNTSVDVHTYFSHVVVEAVLAKLQHPTCMTQADPIETRVLPTLWHMLQANASVSQSDCEPSSMPEAVVRSRDHLALASMARGAYSPKDPLPLDSPANPASAKAHSADRKPTATQTNTACSEVLSGTAQALPHTSGQAVKLESSCVDPSNALESIPAAELKPRILHPCGLHVVSTDVSRYLGDLQHDVRSADMLDTQGLVSLLGSEERANLAQHEQAAADQVAARLGFVESFLQGTLMRKTDQLQTSWDEHNALVDYLQFLDQPTETILAQMTDNALGSPSPSPQNQPADPTITIAPDH